MKKIRIIDDFEVPQIALGCWRMDVLPQDDSVKVIENAMEQGVNFFDHADIYGHGVSEQNFGQAFKQTSYTRDQIILQSKAGIFLDENYYDFSKDHLLEAVDGSLKRLQTDYLDVLLLHRPDTLYEPEEVAAAFDVLEKNGKVRYFGVSNQNPMQIELLKTCVKQPLIFNQLQYSVMHTGLIDAGLCVNNRFDTSLDRDGGALEYCRAKKIKLQAWSPLQYGFFEGFYLDNPKFPKLNEIFNALAEKNQVSNSAVAMAWILRHPAFAQCIVGTMKPERLAAMCKATDVILSKQEWYDIYKAAGNIIP